MSYTTLVIWHLIIQSYDIKCFSYMTFKASVIWHFIFQLDNSYYFGYIRHLRLWTQESCFLVHGKKWIRLKNNLTHKNAFSVGLNILWSKIVWGLKQGYAAWHIVGQRRVCLTSFCDLYMILWLLENYTS